MPDGMSKPAVATIRHLLSMVNDTAVRQVRVERLLFDGTRTTEYLDALSAAVEAIAGEANGRTVRQLRIVWDSVLDEWTRSA